MVTRELELGDGRRMAFCLQLVSEGEASALADQEIFRSDVVELFSTSSAGDPEHPAFVGGRYAVELLLEAADVYRRHGLPLSVPGGGRVQLASASSAWLIRRVEQGLVDAVEILPTVLSRPSALSA